MSILKTAARVVRLRMVEWLTHRTDRLGLRAWRSALQREDKVRSILGAKRYESTEEAAWRVAGERQ